MHDLSYLMEHMDEGNNKTVTRELHLTNSMSNLYNNTQNLIGSFTEGPNPNLSNMSNINRSEDLTLNGSIIPPHLKKELACKEIPPEDSKPAVSRKEEEFLFDDRDKYKRKTNEKQNEDFPMQKVLKSLDDEKARF